MLVDGRSSKFARRIKIGHPSHNSDRWGLHYYSSSDTDSFYDGNWALRLESYWQGATIFAVDNNNTTRFQEDVVVGGGVGIGTASPETKLHLDMNYPSEAFPTTTTRGNVGFLMQAANNIVEIGNSGGVNARKAWILARHRDVDDFGKYYGTLHLQPDVGDKSSYRGVAIGYEAETHVSNGTHLDVNGTARAKEVIVEADWADFVFEEEYDLPTLGEVKGHIEERGHLPDIPSAEEVEASGVRLGDMDAKLLQKIEELTLYAIEREEQAEAQLGRITELEARNAAQQEQIEQQRRRIDRLERLVRAMGEETQ